MTTSRMTSRINLRAPVIVTLALAVLMGPFFAWQSATGEEGKPSASIAPQGIVVVGDSITARYNDRPGDDRQGWWSIVGRHYDAHVTTYAQSGSGYVRPGLKCSGNRFIDRDRAFIGTAPSLLIVEGGRNDWAVCEQGRFVVAADAVIEHAVDRYLETLTTFLPRSTRIVVLGPPWGPLDPAHGVRVTNIIETVAKRHGLQFISTTGALTADRVIDGIHPNRAGSRAIAARVIRTLGG